MILRISFHKISAAGLLAFLSACTTYPPEESVVGDYLSGRLAARTNDVATAAEAFSNAEAEAPGSVEILRDAFLFQLAAGNVDAAIPFAERMSKREGAEDGGVAEFVIAAHAIRNNNMSKARTLLSRDEYVGFLKAPVNILRAWAVEATDGPEAAIEVLRENAGSEYKGFYPLHQGLLSEKAGLMDEARAGYQLSVMTFGGTSEVDSYGAFLERVGDEPTAREYYDLLKAEAGPGRITAIAGLDRLNRGAGAPRLTRANPRSGSAMALYALASGMLQENVRRQTAAEEAGFRINSVDHNLSLALTQLALYLDPTLDDARRFAASILNFYGEHEKAIAMLEKIPPSSPYYNQGQIDIAVSLNALERSDEAIDILRSAIKDSDDDFDARLSLAGLLAFREDHDEAIEVLDRLIADLPEEPAGDAWRYHLSRAASLMEVGQWPRAELDLKRAVELAPEEATTLNYLGYSWAERGENLDEAFELIEKAVSLDPSSGPIIDSLGWAHYQLGNYDEAIGHLEQAAMLEPSDPTITDHLGDVYWRLGRPIEARYQWRHVLELDPDEDLKAAVEDKLENGLPEKEVEKE